MEHIAHGNYILVEDIDNEQVTDGGIVLATGVVKQEISKRSRVVSVSEKLERQFKEMGYKHSIKNGDVIYRRYFSGNEIKTRDNKTLNALHIDDVLSKEFTG
ncbi:co-chaperonin GroES [Acinetobacter phage vB_AbaM_B09_Aci05]|uniref:Uncharacterized protein n=2 Tax=Saclayvirus TaxID=2733128 RepID=A0A386KJG4_9CAUD|nr:co-chaperonin GroES [Acinetobacter phage vB_AbaM_B09_Aci02-2]YP_009813874.1 co-chaperonin GroES [Acinetobacter phage vB_AbaM_B09_Aci05]AYD82411.1 hypothetical protein Aci05_020 [Acinetobacter phage vB_AbaM_B09_Aci05]AYD85788.1 hypothetical protein Aci022_022 [Acinetobacter phage vB_AbaM_B09_Aci02-2]